MATHTGRLHCPLRAMGALAFSVLALISGCGTTTEKPVYSGLTAGSAVPPRSSESVTGLSKSPAVSVVLSESSRETVKLFREIEEMGYPMPVKKWVAELLIPVKSANQSAQMVSDLRSMPPGSWVVVVHWIADMGPGRHGAALEYRILDQNLAEVSVFSAKDVEDCNSYRLDATGAAGRSAFGQCYDRMMSRLISKVTPEMVRATHNSTPRRS